MDKNFSGVRKDSPGLNRVSFIFFQLLFSFYSNIATVKSRFLC